MISMVTEVEKGSTQDMSDLTIAVCRGEVRRILSEYFYFLR